MASIGSQKLHNINLKKLFFLSSSRLQGSATPPLTTSEAVVVSVCTSISAHGTPARSAYLGSLEAHARPLGGSKMHSLRDVVTTAHFGHKGSRKADNELPALLYSPVDLDPLLAQHLWGDLGRQCQLRWMHAHYGPARQPLCCMAQDTSQGYVKVQLMGGLLNQPDYYNPSENIKTIMIA